MRWAITALVYDSKLCNQLFSVRWRIIDPIIGAGRVLREQEVTETVWRYSSELQESDIATNAHLPLRVDVAQISEKFGPGPAAGILLE